MAEEQAGNKKIKEDNADAKHREGFCPLVFWSDLTAFDKDILLRQNAGRRFDSSTALYAAKRCSYGRPQILVCAPIARGVPFPTLFWLTCPYLDRKCGEIESQQKIAELEDIFKSKADEVSDFHKKYAELRVSLTDTRTLEKLKAKHRGMWETITESGIGGINWKEAPFAAKCVHLQLAAWLGLGFHPAADWLSLNVGKLECESDDCAKI